ncbi:hypothetical protein [Nocardioides convexus]|uniref:hypothetical protein n=1 Tax=Nocardioides convexus TaxID=2712224 RepID=UPI002418BB48|nr:hypothetical protein [Nocardioides convexus]
MAAGALAQLADPRRQHRTRRARTCRRHRGGLTMPWDPPEISTDPDEVTATILDGPASRLVGWEATEGAPEVALAEEVGREIAILNQTTAEVLQAGGRRHG